MERKFYIVPGWGDTCRRKQYQQLANAVREKGYDVVFKNVDWKDKLSKQIFQVEKESIVFGFSMGAILARLIVQEYSCNIVIFASMTPLVHFKGGKPEKLLVNAIGKLTVLDVKKHLKPKIKAKRKILMYGDKENEKADIIVPNTDHEITTDYIREIVKII